MIAETPAATWVFISHDHARTQGAARVASYLEAHGITCWYAARDLPPSDSGIRAITSALSVATALVLLHDADADASPEVQREILYAERAGLRQFWIGLGPVEPAQLSYLPSGTHWIDSVDGIENALDELVFALRQSRSTEPPTQLARPAEVPSIAAAAAPRRRWRRRTTLTATAVVTAMIAGTFVLVHLLRDPAVGERLSRFEVPGASQTILASDGSRLFVTSMPTGASPEGRLTVLSLPGGALVKTVQLDGTPASAALSADGGKLWVTTNSPSFVDIVDLNYLDNVDRIASPDKLAGIAFTRAGTLVVIAATAKQEVKVFDPITHALRKSISVAQPPVAVAPGPQENSAYVTELGDDTKSARAVRLDLATGQSVFSVDVGRDPYGIAVSPDASQLFVANRRTTVLSVIDRFPSVQVRLAPVGSNPNSIAVESTGARVYVANEGEKAITTVGVGQPLTTKRIAIGALPNGLALSRNGHRLYVAERAAGLVEVISV